MWIIYQIIKCFAPSKSWARRTNSLKCKEIRLPTGTACARWLTCRNTWSKRTGGARPTGRKHPAQGLNPFRTVSAGWSEGTESLEPQTQGESALNSRPLSSRLSRFSEEKIWVRLGDRRLPPAWSSLGGESSNHRRKETRPHPQDSPLFHCWAKTLPHRGRAESPLACRDMWESLQLGDKKNPSAPEQRWISTGLLPGGVAGSPGMPQTQPRRGFLNWY